MITRNQKHRPKRDNAPRQDTGIFSLTPWTNIHDGLFSIPILTVTILTLTLILTILTITIHRGWKITWSRSNYPSLGWIISSMMLFSIRDGQIDMTGTILCPQGRKIVPVYLPTELWIEAFSVLKSTSRPLTDGRNCIQINP